MGRRAAVRFLAMAENVVHDVLVIGAGPAGSRLAARLAEKGHRVLVLEEHPRAGEAVCCTGIVSRECYERFSLPGSAVLGQSRSARFVSPGQRVIRLQKSAVQAYVLDRGALDRSLAERAASAGAELRFGCRVEGVRGVDGHVEARCLVGDRTTLLSGRALVLASGFNPGLIAGAGLGPLGDFAVGAQAEMEVSGLEEVEIYFSREFAPGFFAWIVPVARNRALVGLMARQRPGQHMKRFLAYLLGSKRIGSMDCDVHYGRVPLRPLKSSHSRRILAVGDAAGQVKPTTGGGIYYGLLCADIAAEVLQDCLSRDELSERRLGRYEREWRRMLGPELSIGYFCRLVFERLGDSAIDELFDVVTENSLHIEALRTEGFSFDWHGGVLRRGLTNPGVRRVLGLGLKGLLGAAGGKPVRGLAP